MGTILNVAEFLGEFLAIIIYNAAYISAWAALSANGKQQRLGGGNGESGIIPY